MNEKELEALAKWVEGVERRLQALEAQAGVSAVSPDEALAAGLASYRRRKHGRAES